MRGYRRAMNEKIAPKILPLIQQIKSHLLARYGDKLRRVILYGSHARGGATEDSDIDLLVLVDKDLCPREVRESLSDLLLDILLETGELVSVQVLSEEFFETYRYPFILNVKREGISV